jgi:secreted trypsin-like serine protease
MQDSTNARQTPPGRRAGHGSGVLLAVLAMLLLSLFAILEGDRRAQAIIGGSKVEKNTKPFVVSFLDTRFKPPQVFCTGTLIANDRVLTAAHCLNRFNNKDLARQSLRMVIGSTDLTDASQGEVRSISDYSICCDEPQNSGENYDGQKAPNKYDAAVLRLSNPVNNIEPIQLATRDQDSLEAAGNKGIVAGWGTTTNCAGTDKDPCVSPGKLHEVPVRIRGDQAFENQLSNINLKGIKFHPDLMVAAGGKRGQGMCGGDSGGPLLVEDKPGHYTQIGISSVGKCGSNLSYLPDLYTEVNNCTIRNFITRAAGLKVGNCSKVAGKPSGNQGGGDQGGGGNQGGGGSNQGGSKPPSDPGTTDPGTTDPGTTDPGTTDPGTTDPSTTDPGTTDPGTTDPGTTDPGTTDPGTTDPGTTDPGTTDPGGGTGGIG